MPSYIQQRGWYRGGSHNHQPNARWESPETSLSPFTLNVSRVLLKESSNGSFTGIPPSHMNCIFVFPWPLAGVMGYSFSFLKGSVLSFNRLTEWKCTVGKSSNTSGAELFIDYLFACEVRLHSNKLV